MLTSAQLLLWLLAVGLFIRDRREHAAALRAAKQEATDAIERCVELTVELDHYREEDERKSAGRGLARVVRIH